MHEGKVGVGGEGIGTEGAQRQRVGGADADGVRTEEEKRETGITGSIYVN